MVTWIGASLLVGLAQAYWVGEHETLTRAAFEELAGCGISYSERDQRAILDSNRGEDTNLVRKWSRDSHFYSPVRDLDQRRRTSMDRVIEVQVDSSPAALGVLLHHVQDASVPAHVVPINHWIGDGFEKFDAGLAPSAGECAESQLFRNLRRASDVLQRLAETTLTAAVDAHPWNRFWREGRGNAFGVYGELGDAFGSSPALTQADYRRFKQSQMRLAIDASKWVLRKGASVLSEIRL